MRFKFSVFAPRVDLVLATSQTLLFRVEFFSGLGSHYCLISSFSLLSGGALLSLVEVRLLESLCLACYRRSVPKLISLCI